MGPIYTRDLVGALMMIAEVSLSHEMNMRVLNMRVLNVRVLNVRVLEACGTCEVVLCFHVHFMSVVVFRVCSYSYLAHPWWR